VKASPAQDGGGRRQAKTRRIRKYQPNGNRIRRQAFAFQAAQELILSGAAQAQTATPSRSCIVGAREFKKQGSRKNGA